MTTPAPVAQEPHLRRRLGLLQATALNMSNMVGVGPSSRYLTLGAKICGPPTLNAHFLDFLTLLDLDVLHPLARMRFLG